MANPETKPIIKLDQPLELLVDKNQDSRRAIRLMKLSGLPFTEISASGYNVPIVFGPDGFTFRYLSGIEQLVRGANLEAYEQYFKEKSKKP